MTSRKGRRGPGHKTRKPDNSTTQPDSRIHHADGDQPDDEYQPRGGKPPGDLAASIRENSGSLALLLALIPAFFAIARLYIMADGNHHSLVVLGSEISFPRLAQGAFVNSFQALFMIVVLIFLVAIADSLWFPAAQGVAAALAFFILAPVFLLPLLILLATRAPAKLRYLSTPPTGIRLIVGALLSLVMTVSISVRETLPLEAITIKGEIEATVFIVDSDDHQITLLHRDGRVQLVDPNDVRSRRLCSDDGASISQVLLIMPTGQIVIKLGENHDWRSLRPEASERCPTTGKSASR